MRNIKELLELMLENINKINGCGLCNLVKNLYIDNLISLEERILLYKFIKNSEPYPQDNSFYFWEPGKIEPRKKYLEKYISMSLEKLEEILEDAIKHK